MGQRPHPWTASAVYIGAVVGAGFGSGREILLFFGAHGAMGLAGAALATLGFAWFGGRVLGLAVRHQLHDHRTLLRYLLPPAVARPLDLATTVCLFLGLGIVLAGGGALAEEFTRFPYGLGAAALALLTAGILVAGRLGLLLGNAVLVPLLVLFCLLLAGAEATTPGWGLRVVAARPDAALAVGNWYIGALLYLGYNLLAAAVSLCAAAPAFNGARAIGAWGALGGAVLGGLVALVTATLLGRYDAVAAAQLPLGSVAAERGPAWAAAYAVVLGAALLTTALATCCALAARLASPSRLMLAGPLAAAAALPLAWLGFPRLVAAVYPAMGLLGGILLAALAWQALRQG